MSMLDAIPGVAQVKAFIAALVLAGVAILFTLLKIEKKKTESLKEDKRVLKNNAKETAVITKDRLDVKDFEVDREKKKADIEGKVEAIKAGNADKVENTPDGEPYEVKL